MILIRLEQGPIVERDNHRIINVRYFEKSVSLPSSGDIFISDKIKTPHKVLRDIDIPLFKESIQKLQKGIIPEKVYPEVIIYYSKEKLMKDFEEFIDKMQEIYFKQYPENRSPEYGHKEYKADKWEKKREKKYPFDEFERYFKVYILCEIFSKKQRDVAKEIFPKDTVGSGDAKISQDLRKARKLIENAFTKNFPGKY